jgi:urea transport system permease protein
MLKIGEARPIQGRHPRLHGVPRVPQTLPPETGGLPPHGSPSKFHLRRRRCVIVPAVVAFIFGWLAFRSRIKGVYFSILSQALTYAATLMFFRNDFTFGGNNGSPISSSSSATTSIPRHQTRPLHRLRHPPPRSSTSSAAGSRPPSSASSSAPSATAKTACSSPATPPPTSNSSSSSSPPSSAASAAPSTSRRSASSTPAKWPPTNPSKPSSGAPSAAAARSLGPILGAIGVNALKSYATRAFAEQWLYFLGGLFIFVTLFMPKGIIGLPEQLRALENASPLQAGTRIRRRRLPEAHPQPVA